MKLFINFLSKGLKAGLVFITFWYAVWILITVVAFLVMIFISDEKLKLYYFFQDCLFILINSFFYLKVALILKRMFSSRTVNSYDLLGKLSFCFFILFSLDLISLFSGGINSGKASAQRVLELLPEDSLYYSVYSKIYIYIPAVFDFVKPHFEGTSLLIVALVCAGFAKRNESLAPTLNMQEEK